MNAVACGSQQPFEQYRRGDDVGYGGTVEPSPEGRWKAKVKIKRCQGGEFVELSSQKIVGLPDGRFQGVFDDLEPGSYQIRARYQGEDRPESHKLYFQVK